MEKGEQVLRRINFSELHFTDRKVKEAFAWLQIEPMAKLYQEMSERL